MLNPHVTIYCMHYHFDKELLTETKVNFKTFYDLLTLILWYKTFRQLQVVAKENISLESITIDVYVGNNANR